MNGCTVGPAPRLLAVLVSVALLPIGLENTALAGDQDDSRGSNPAFTLKAEVTVGGSQRRTSGVVVVHVVERARVLVDRGEVGHADPSKPLETSLPVGRHTVRVVYERGGDDSRKVLVAEGQVSDIDFAALPESRVVYDGRRGRWIPGVALGGGLYHAPLGDRLGQQGSAGVVLARALSTSMDFRLILGIHGWHAVDVRTHYNPSRDADGYLWERKTNFAGLYASVEPGLVFRVGTMFTFGFSAAVRAGVVIPIATSLRQLDGLGALPESTNPTAAADVAVAARVSPIGLAFGERREHHLELLGGIVGSLFGVGVDVGELRYTYSF